MLHNNCIPQPAGDYGTHGMRYYLYITWNVASDDNVHCRCSGAQDDALKDHLIEDLNYSLVPEGGWNKLLIWYGLAEGSRPIARKVIEWGMYVKYLKVRHRPIPFSAFVQLPELVSVMPPIEPIPLCRLRCTPSVSILVSIP